MVIIKKVETRKDMRDFINFPNILYKNNPLFVPSIYSDELADWNKKKNPAFDYCDAEAYLAYKDGELSGRIAAIYSKNPMKNGKPKE